MPLLLIDYMFNEKKERYEIIGDNFTGCMRTIDKERGNNILVNDLDYKIKLRCSPVFEVDKTKFYKILKIIKEDRKYFLDLIDSKYDSK